jgi:guanine deaminase
MTMPLTLLTGQVLDLATAPFRVPPETAARHHRRGGVLVGGGRILAVGEADALRAAHPQAALVAHGEGLILPGFVDAHAHYPQTAIIASWGKRLIDWLNLYTFPEEMRFADPAYAEAVAARYLDLFVLHHPSGLGRCAVRSGRGAGHGGGDGQDLHGPQRARGAARHCAVCP